MVIGCKCSLVIYGKCWGTFGETVRGISWENAWGKRLIIIANIQIICLHCFVLQNHWITSNLKQHGTIMNSIQTHDFSLIDVPMTKHRRLIPPISSFWEKEIIDLSTVCEFPLNGIIICFRNPLRKQRIGYWYQTRNLGWHLLTDCSFKSEMNEQIKEKQTEG